MSIIDKLTDSRPDNGLGHPEPLSVANGPDAYKKLGEIRRRNAAAAEAEATQRRDVLGAAAAAGTVTIPENLAEATPAALEQPVEAEQNVDQRVA